MDGGKVDLQHIWEPQPSAAVSPKHFDRREHSDDFQKEIEEASEASDLSRGLSPYSAFGRSNYATFYRWSSNYQFLPCEVDFIKDSGTEVQITSYINNLHPMHTGLYQAIEKLVSLAIEPWNECLVKGQPAWGDVQNQGQLGPIPLRIITYGIEWENELPEWAVAFNVPSESRKRSYREVQERVQNASNDKSPGGPTSYLEAFDALRPLRDVGEKLNMELPPPESNLWQRAKAYLELPEDNSNTVIKIPDDWADRSEPWFILKVKAARAVRFKHPEPGTAFSYENWKAGRHNDKAIIDMDKNRNIRIPPHTAYTIRIQDAFRKKGLEVIVKMENIELTPQTPSYSSDIWELEGQSNEHIVAVAVFAYEVANIPEPRIEFRQYTRLKKSFYQYDEEEFPTTDDGWKDMYPSRIGKSYEREFKTMASILGFPPRDLSARFDGGMSLQTTGSVATPQGRLVIFPNVLEHRLKPFKLSDPTRSGHYRYIKLYLVDPHYRVCSTRNVPPQRLDWWADEVSKDLASFGLPRELLDAIFQEVDGWPMGLSEAMQHRQELTKEHRWNELIRLANMRTWFRESIV
jgi:hypothetical protein